MKRKEGTFEDAIIVLILLTVIVLPVVLAWLPPKNTETESSSDYDEGYEIGCEVGYDDGYDDGFDAGYEEGYSAEKSDEYIFGYSDKSIKIIQNVEDDAWRYAGDKSGWDPEGAMGNIESYINNKPDVFGDYCTKEDFMDSVMSLYYFFEYFYSNKYQ